MSKALIAGLALCAGVAGATAQETLVPGPGGEIHIPPWIAAPAPPVQAGPAGIEIRMGDTVLMVTVMQAPGVSAPARAAPDHRPEDGFIACINGKAMFRENGRRRFTDGAGYCD
mgnify:CR=1 FL=1